MATINLTLYVSGRTQKTLQSIAQLTVLCKKKLNTVCSVRVVDILEKPLEAEDNKIMATPTLVRETPPPRRRVVGDLSNVDCVFANLGLETE